MKRLAVVGGRDYPNPDYVRQYVGFQPEGTILVNGLARGRTPERSVDHVAKLAAEARGMTVEPYPADWNGLLGKLAGFDRNFDLVLASTDVAAFWDGWSRGTAHAIALAACHGNLRRVVLPDDLSLAEFRARELAARFGLAARDDLLRAALELKP